jgi:hypothetical protein
MTLADNIMHYHVGLIHALILMANQGHYTSPFGPSSLCCPHERINAAQFSIREPQAQGLLFPNTCRLCVDAEIGLTMQICFPTYMLLTLQFSSHLLFTIHKIRHISLPRCFSSFVSDVLAQNLRWKVMLNIVAWSIHFAHTIKSPSTLYVNH